MLLYDLSCIESIPTLKYFNLLVYKLNENNTKLKKLLNFQIVYLKRHTFLKEPSNANKNNECN